jgi:hypothetical protein
LKTFNRKKARDILKMICRNSYGSKSSRWRYPTGYTIRKAVIHHRNRATEIFLIRPGRHLN